AATSARWTAAAQGSSEELICAIGSHVHLKSLSNPRRGRRATTRLGRDRRQSIQLGLEGCASLCISYSRPRPNPDAGRSANTIGGPVGGISSSARPPRG